MKKKGPRPKIDVYKFNTPAQIWEKIKGDPYQQEWIIYKDPNFAFRIYERFEDLNFGKLFYQEYQDHEKYGGLARDICIRIKNKRLDSNFSDPETKSIGRRGTPAGHHKTSKKQKRYSHLFEN